MRLFTFSRIKEQKGLSARYFFAADITNTVRQHLSCIKLLLISFGWPTIAVDTHIESVSHRTKFAMGKNVVEVEKKLEEVVPKEFKVDVHHWLILHGRYTCVARKPKCGSCIIEDLCEFKDKAE